MGLQLLNIKSLMQNRKENTHTHTQMGMAKQKGEINPFLLPEK